MKICVHFFWFASMEATGINLDRQVISSCSISACGKCQCKLKMVGCQAVDKWWNIDDGCIRSIMYYSSYCIIYIHGKIHDFWCNCLSFGVLTHLQKKSWPCEWHYGPATLQEVPACHPFAPRPTAIPFPSRRFPRPTSVWCAAFVPWMTRRRRSKSWILRFR